MQNHSVPLSAHPDGRRHLGIRKSRTYAVRALLIIMLALCIFPKLNFKKEKIRKNKEKKKRKEAAKQPCNCRTQGGNAKPNVVDKYSMFSSSELKIIIIYKKKKKLKEQSTVRKQLK